MDPDEIKNDYLDLTIVSPEDTVFAGKVKVISLKNELGPFDIIPYHETFISLISEKLVIYPLDGPRKEIMVDKGVVRVFKNNVQIYLGLNTEKLLEMAENHLGIQSQ